MKTIYKLLASLIICGFVHGQNTINFDEEFVFHPQKALKELIPGTEKYFYYHCLYYQNQKDTVNFKAFQKRWHSSFKLYPTELYHEIANRQALLDYEKQQNLSLAYITNKLNLKFNHQKMDEERKVNYPAKLDPQLISWTRHRNTQLDYLTDEALEIYSKKNLSWGDRRKLLQRVKSAAFPKLVQHIIADLKAPKKGTFGYLKIHKLLTLAQLGQCQQAMPQLASNKIFVHEYIKRLRPAQHQNWQQDESAKTAYLNTLWQYVETLPSIFNSLKANTLAHKLFHERSLGTFDQELFLTYLKLPKNTFYINRKYIKQQSLRLSQANIHTDFKKLTGLDIIAPFEAQLVKDFLDVTFQKANDFQKFLPYVEEQFLTRFFAETKILHGLGDAEKWYAFFKHDANAIKAIKDRIELRMLPQNKQFIGSHDPVSLSLDLKNIPKLLVKTYKINLFNYYKNYQKQVSSDIDLDGMVAAEQKTLYYKHNSQVRHREKFNPTLTEPGVYIIEFIGNGISSRALIHKGNLRYTVSDSAAGHVFNIYNDQNEHLKDAEVFLGGHNYKSQKEGFILVPYTNSAASQRLIIKHNGFAHFQFFNHKTENVKFKASFYINRESLIKQGQAKLLIRPLLTLNQSRIPLSLLKDVTLTLTSKDLKGISSSLTVNDFQLFESKDSVHSFSVPKGLVHLSYKITAKIQKMTDGSLQTLLASGSMDINSNFMNSDLKKVFLRENDQGYILEVLGRTGEAWKQVPLNLSFRHRYLQRSIHTTLKTDENGEVFLGKLPQITTISINAPSINRFIQLKDHSIIYSPAVITANKTEFIKIPFQSDNSPLTEQCSLIEYRYGLPVKDHLQSLTFKDQYLEIKDLPEGDFKLYQKKHKRLIEISILQGRKQRNYTLGKNRILRGNNHVSPVIAGIQSQEKGYAIQLNNASPRTRVHVIQTRFYPNYRELLALFGQNPTSASLYNYLKPESFYLSERNIGDEFRYILTRRNGKIYPGNMLERPGLLLNPWELRDTSTGKNIAAEGGAFGGRGIAGRASSVSSFGGGVAGGRAYKQNVSFDFLQKGNRLFTNLKADKNGLITIPQAGRGQMLHVFLIDGNNSLYKRAFIKDEEKPYRDLSLHAILNPKTHSIEKKKISVIKKGENFTLKGISSAKIETYDSLRKVYGLMKTLNADDKLNEFAFILKWPTLKAEEKLDYYSKYSCHELNFFIYKKDPQFFKETILPYYANKKDDTFLDLWLKSSPELKEYSKEWQYSRLNIVERILLAKRFKSPNIQQEMKDLFELLKRDRNYFSKLFDSAVQSDGLSSKVNSVSKSLERRQLAKKKLALKGSKENKKSRVASLVDSLSKDEANTPAPMVAEEAMLEDFESEEDAFSADDSSDLVGGITDVSAYRSIAQQYYRQLGPVKEWVENNYYKLSIERHTASLVKINTFWKDYADHQQGPFISTHIAEATNSFTEMMFALAVLDLPFESGKITSRFEGDKMIISSENDLIIFHREIENTQEEKKEILVKQQFFDISNRYKQEGNERIEKYLTQEFESGKVYGAKIIMTNPNSRALKLEVLKQIPAGAIPVNRGLETMTDFIHLGAYSTQTLQYFFYFPYAGQFEQFPVHASSQEKLVGYESPFHFNVVDEATIIDKTSWVYISQNANEQDTLNYLQNNNLNRIDLNLILWRLKNPAFAKQLLDLLKKKNIYHQSSYSYAIKHNILFAAKEYLKFSPMAQQCGLYLKSPLLNINPVQTFKYQHREYSPLVNARTYQLGKVKKIVNQEFLKQYNLYMKMLTYINKPSAEEQLTQAYYLLLQDRVETAIRLFQKINRADINEQIQYDYMKAYIAFYLEQPNEALEISQNYLTYPVLKWRQKFAAVIDQVKEINGGVTQATDNGNRQDMQNELASKEATVEFKINESTITAYIKNLPTVTVNYYPMDIELLFSKKPFLKGISSDFSIIQPNFSEQKKVVNNNLTFKIPEALSKRNLMIEIVGKGVTETQAYYAHTMKVSLMKNYGMLQAVDSTEKPLSKVYVKVYARTRNGKVVFHKDGYTDLRGKFDYSSINTGNMNNIASLAMLVLSDSHGAIIKEIKPPKK